MRESLFSLNGCRGDIVFETLSPKSRRTLTNRLAVTAARGHYVAQQRSKTRRIGKRSFKLAAGQSAKLPVRIAYRGHFEIASRRRRRRAVMKVVERDATGKVVDTQTRVVTLRPRTNKWSRIRRHHH